MLRKDFTYLPMDRVTPVDENPIVPWIWHGYLARGNLTLLTSLWKSGKTTLVTGLFRALGTGEPFLGRSCAACKVAIVSEESRDLWASRLHANPVGAHARLMARPYLCQPSQKSWNTLIGQMILQQERGELDLFVVDPLASFLPGNSESDPGTLRGMLYPLQRLAEAGAAVLILHHPRKEKSATGSSARGSGALLGFVDIALELRAFGGLKSDNRRRRIDARSRYSETPDVLAYEWVSDSGPFVVVDDLRSVSFKENWDTLRQILARYRRGCAVAQILADWSDDEKPSPSTVSRWLARGLDEKLVRREGQGAKTNPYRYRLPNEDDEYWDRGELPPIRVERG